MHTRDTCVLALAIVVAGLSRAPAQGGAGGDQPCPAEPARFHPCALAKARTFDPPRTADGHPDLQGFWRGQPAATENVEEHPKTADDAGGKSLIVEPPDGRIPYQTWAASLPRAHAKKYVEPNVPCFPSGVPRSMYLPTQIQIVQSPGYVVVLFERGHLYRVIQLAGRPHVPAGIQLWQGDSRGRWEGNTLVVDVTNQNARAWFDQAANFYTDATRMVESLTLIGADTIHYQVTIEDSGLYTRPWTMAFPMRRTRDAGLELFEEACFEGERNTDPLIELGYRFYPGMKGSGTR